MGVSMITSTLPAQPKKIAADDAVNRNGVFHFCRRDVDWAENRLAAQGRARGQHQGVALDHSGNGANTKGASRE